MQLYILHYYLPPLVVSACLQGSYFLLAQHDVLLSLAQVLYRLGYAS